MKCPPIDQTFTTSPALAPHPRQHELRSRTRPKTLVSNCGARRPSDRLDRAGLAVAGVVDQRADRAVLGLDRRDRRAHRGLVGDVERQHPAARRLEVGERLGPARRRVDVQPRAASRSAVARPMPDEQPVTSAGPGGGRVGHGGETIGPMAAQQHLDRLSARRRRRSCAQERPTTHMHIGGARAVRGRRRPGSRTSSRTSRRGCTSSRATARSSRCRRSGPAGRCGSTTRRSTSSTTCATRRCRRRATRTRCCELVARDLLPAPGPLEAAVGAVARRGAVRRRLRADLEDPPRARRRRLGRRPRDACCSTSAARAPSCRRRRAVGPAARADRRRARRARAAGRGDARSRSRVRRARAAVRTRARRSTARARSPRGLGEVAMTALNPPPTTPFNVAPGPHRRVAVVHAELDEFKQVKGALGGTVNDVVLAVVAGALALLHAGARAAHRRPRAARRACRCRCARTDQRGALGNQITHHHGAAARSTSTTRSRGCATCARRCGPEGVQAGARREGDRLAAGLRAADDPRPGVAAELLLAHLQPARHQRARPAVPALRARPPARADLPGAVPGRRARAGDRDHVLRRRDRTSACSATTTRCRTSTSLAEGIEGALAELALLARRHKRIEERKAKRRRPASGSGRARPSGRAGKGR